MSNVVEVKIPDIGDFKDVEIVDVLVKPGDSVKAEDPLITLESDKATIDIPSPETGVIKLIKVKKGDRVSQGDAIADMESDASEARGDGSGGSRAESNEENEKRTPESAPEPKPDTGDEGKADSNVQSPRAAATRRSGPRPSPTASIVNEEGFRKAHASPAVRRFARELGVDLGQVDGGGPKGRILKDDVQGYVKRALSQGGGGLGVAPMPEIDFSQFGRIETQALTKINKLTGQNLHRNWVTIPHVTQFDEADITELESFRKTLGEEYKDKGIKITFLAFLMKAVVSALKEYPRVNSSLDATGENLILKHYYHIGVAVDTADGLVVPVIRDVDRMSLVDIASALQEMSAKARDKKLKPGDMQGGCFTISSLGGIGGTSFAPIVNAPEVAILGVSRAKMQPVWNGKEFAPRMILPLSLSYDHRVIDGALGARFTTFLSSRLSDMRRMLL